MLNIEKFLLLLPLLLQGAPGVGHYWSYIHHPRANKWLKYNDLRVSEVDEQTVMKEATGGKRILMFFVN